MKRTFRLTFFTILALFMITALVTDNANATNGRLATQGGAPGETFAGNTTVGQTDMVTSSNAVDKISLPAVTSETVIARTPRDGQVICTNIGSDGAKINYLITAKMDGNNVKTITYKQTITISGIDDGDCVLKVSNGIRGASERSMVRREAAVDTKGGWTLQVFA